MKNIVLYGAGGHCYAAIELINSLKAFTPIVIYDDSPKEKEILAVPVKKYEMKANQIGDLCISIGDNKSRKMISQKFESNYPSFVHDSAVVYPSVKIGKGTLVHPNVVLDAAVSLGNFCIVNNNATVSHNAMIGDYVHIAIQVAIAGGVTIGEGTLIGAGSVILPDIKIGKWVTVGAGSIVTKDLPDNVKVYGNPAAIKSPN